MAEDAQRLIKVSMGKITASRGQRGGINLHKNLLVATVLYKAKTVFMLENYHNLMENRRIQLESEEAIVQLEQTHENNGTPNAGLHEVQPPTSDEALNGEVSQQSCMFASSVQCDSPITEDDKENSPPETCLQDQELVEDSAMSLDANCVRCTKRRLTENDMYDLDSNIPTKKHKSDFETESPYLLDNSVAITYEKMQTETPQMASLVNSFSAGFTGLLNSDSHPNTDQGYSSSEEDDDDDVFTSSSKRRNTSENSLLSCSTQIKEAFETLARPCIALTV